MQAGVMITYHEEQGIVVGSGPACIIAWDPVSKNQSSYAWEMTQ